MSNLNDQLKDMFDSAEFQPTDRVWQGVEKALLKKQKRGVLWYWQTYAAAAFVLFLASFLWMISPDEGAPVDFLNERKGSNPFALKSNDSTGVNAIGKDTLETQSKKKLFAQAPQEPLATPTNVLKDQLSLVEINSGSGMKKVRFDSSDMRKAYPVVSRALPRALKPSLAFEILSFQAKMNMTWFNPKTRATEMEEERPTPKALRINGGIGSGTLNSGESGLFSLGADEEAAIAFSDARVAIAHGEEQVESVIGIGGGVNLELSEKVSLDAGLRVSNFRVSSSSNAYSVENGLSLPISSSAPFDPTQVLFVGDYSTSNTFQSLFVQSAINYRLAHFGKFDLNTRIGVGIDFFFNYKLQGDLNFLSVRKVNLSQSDMSSTSLSVIPGVGLNYRINENFGLGIDASYRRFITNSSVNINGATSVFALGFSLNYLLKKD